MSTIGASLELPARIRGLPSKSTAGKSNNRPTLSTAEKKELDQMGDTIEAAEAKVAEIRKHMEDPKFATDHVKLQKCMDDVEAAENKVHDLYSRWGELAARQEKAEV